MYLGKWRDATDVAVKCLSPALWASSGEGTNGAAGHIKDLICEAKMLFGLRHPNVVWVYGIVLDQTDEDLDTRFRAPAIVAGTAIFVD